MKKDNILKHNYDFQRIIKNSKPYKTRNYIVYVEQNGTDKYYFGFSVGKKVGNAVMRNKIKRQLKSIVSKKDYQKGFNCIIIVSSNILNIEYIEREKELLKILLELKLIKEKKDE